MSLSGDSIKFSVVCELFEKLSTLKHNAKLKLLGEFLQEYFMDDLYPFLRVLLPQVDKERKNYHLREAFIAKLYADTLQLGKNSEYRTIMNKWRDPNVLKGFAGVTVGEFPTVLRYVLRQFSAVAKGTITLGEANAFLDELEAVADREGRMDVFSRIFAVASVDEQFWMSKIILKDLKIGIRHEAVIKNIHPNAMDIYNSTASLKQVCEAVRNPEIFDRFKTVNLFSTIKPMLAKRCHYNDVESLMKHEEFAIETKFDGERILCHIDEEKGRIMFQTRNAIDYTDLYSPHLGKLILRSVKRKIKCILDGELVVWNSRANHMEPFGQNKPVDNVFDILYIGDVDVTSCTYRQRRDFLHSIITPVPHRFEVVTTTFGMRKDEVISSLDDAINRNEEGIIIKSVKSAYSIGERLNSWLKLKPDYIDEFGETLDLLLMGGFYGEGWKGGRISHFLLGVSVLKDESDKLPTKFYTFTKAGSGVSMNLMNEIKERIGKHWKPFHKLNPPSHLTNWIAGKDEAPDFWIEPEKSIILEIKAAEIIKSEKFEAGVSLRFPRVQKIRDDKNWYECLDYGTLLKLFAEFRGRIVKRRVVGDDGEASQSQAEAEDSTNKERGRKRTRAGGPPRSLDVLPSFRAHEKVQGVTDGLMAGIEVCVFPGNYPRPISKRDLEGSVLASGGKIVQNPTINTTFIIASGEKSLKVRNWIKMTNRNPVSEKDILRHSWITDSIEAGCLMSVQSRYIIHAKPATLEEVRADFDEFGNSHVTPDTQESLIGTFDSISDRYLVEKEERDLEYISEDDIYMFDIFSFFKGYTLYFDVFKDIGSYESFDRLSPLVVSMKHAQYYGAKLSNYIDCSVTHIVIDERDLSRMDQFRSAMNALRRSPQYVTEWQVVSSEWITACIDNKTRRVDASRFRIK